MTVRVHALCVWCSVLAAIPSFGGQAVSPGLVSGTPRVLMQDVDALAVSTSLRSAAPQAAKAQKGKKADKSGDPAVPGDPDQAKDKAKAKDKDKDKDKDGLVWDGRPSLRFGKTFRMDVRLKLQGDVQRSVQVPPGTGGQFEFARKRAGIKGSIYQRVDYEVERDLSSGGQWRDVYVNLNLLSFAQVQGGKFKIPFSSEELTGVTDLDFVYRTRLVDALAPARDVGAMVHGRLFKRVLQYQAGAFRHDGDNPPRVELPALLPNETAGERGRSYAGRVMFAPFRALAGSSALKTLELGAAIVTTTVPEGRNHLQGRSVFDGHFFPRQLSVKGTRVRTGIEMNWTPGPFSVRAEYIRAVEGREGQGVGDETQRDSTLPDLVGRGWYVSGTWVVTGEKTDGGVDPRRPLFRGGFGAIQVGARYETLWFGTPGGEGPASRSPRTDMALANSDTVLTLGLNWHLNRWLRVQVNGIRETFLDPDRSPVPGRPSFWSAVGRLQFSM